MNTASGMMEFEGQNNDFGGTKRYNNIPLVPPNSFGPPTMVAVVVDFKDRDSHAPQITYSLKPKRASLHLTKYRG